MKLDIRVPPGGWGLYRQSVIPWPVFGEIVQMRLQRAIDTKVMPGLCGRSVIELVSMKASGQLRPGDINLALAAADNMVLKARRQLISHGLAFAEDGNLSYETVLKIVGPVVAA